jgi:hypothetical protein
MAELPWCPRWSGLHPLEDAVAAAQKFTAEHDIAHDRFEIGPRLRIVKQRTALLTFPT